MRVLYAVPLIISSALAAPAIIWKQVASKAKQVATTHTSEYTDASDLINKVVKSSEDNSNKLSSVIFLIGRDADGNEALSHLGQNNKLPETKKKYEDYAESVYYNVANLESEHTVLRDAKNALKTKKKGAAPAGALSVSLDELVSKLEDVVQEEEATITSKAKRKRMKAIENAHVLIVHVPDIEEDTSSLDSAISSSIDKSQSTILAGIRSIEEVKNARKLISKMQSTAAYTSHRRRLEDAQDDAADDNNYDGVYYVNMTPNIFAGLLFTFFFVFVTYLGVACMSMIQGQDVYVTKMPGIGREA